MRKERGKLGMNDGIKGESKMEKRDEKIKGDREAKRENFTGLKKVQL